MNLHSTKPNMLYLTQLNGNSFVDARHIIFCKAKGSYTEVFFEQSSKLISKRLKKIELLLSGDEFIRIHHFYLINFSHVKSILKNEGKISVVLSNEVVLPVSRRKLAYFNSLFTSL